MSSNSNTPEPVAGQCPIDCDCPERGIPHATEQDSPGSTPPKRIRLQLRPGTDESSYGHDPQTVMHVLHVPWRLTHESHGIALLDTGEANSRLTLLGQSFEPLRHIIGVNHVSVYPWRFHIQLDVFHDRKPYRRELFALICVATKLTPDQIIRHWDQTTPSHKKSQSLNPGSIDSIDPTY